MKDHRGTPDRVPFRIGGDSVDVDEAYEAWRTAEGQAKNDALESLFKAVKGYAGRLISKLKGMPPEDLADDVAAHVIVNIAKFRGDSKFRTWVGAIAKNEWNDSIKKTIRDRELFVDPRYLPYDLEDPWRGAEEERRPEMYEPLALIEYNRKTKDALHVAEVQEHLGAEDLFIFQAVFAEGKTNREAAEVLSKTEAAVESKVRRLRNKLRGQLRKVA